MKRIVLLAYALTLSACHVVLFQQTAPIASVCVPTSKTACPKHTHTIGVEVPIK